MHQTDKNPWMMLRSARMAAKKHRHWLRRTQAGCKHHPGAILCLLATLLFGGCEPATREALSEKLGERHVTALQDIARDRDCLPLPDIQKIRKAQEATNQIEFLLRDGTRWVNAAEPLDCRVPRPLSVAVKPDTEALCAGDTIRLLESNSTALIDMGLCELTRFQRK